MPDPDQEPRARDRLAIAAAMALAAVLCCLRIDGRSIGFDEAATVAIASQHGSALWTAIAHDGGNMSGYYVVLHGLIVAFGNSELVLRLPSAAATVVTVGIVATIAWRLYGNRAALAAGLLSAVSLPLVFWAQSARGYALMVMFVSGAYLGFISLADPDREHSRARWLVYVVMMALATYSSLVAVLAIPAQLLVLLLSPRRRARVPQFLVAVAGYVVLCVPLVVLAVRRGSGQLFWVPRPSHKVDLQVLESVTSAGLQPSFHRTATTIALLVLTLAGVAVIAVSLLIARRRSEPAWGGLALLAWLVVPVVVTFVYSLFAQPIFVPRNLLMCTPAAALVLAAGIGSRRLHAVPALALLAVFVALHALQIAPSYGVSPEPWQQASATVLARARPGDCIAFYPLDGRMAFQYYYGTRRATDRGAPRPILPLAAWGKVEPFVERYLTLSPAQIRGRGAGCRRLWFVSSHEGERDGPRASLVHRARFHQLKLSLEAVFGRGPVEQLGYASAIHVQLLRGGASRRGR